MDYDYNPQETVTQLEQRYAEMCTQLPEECQHEHCADISGGWGTIRCFDCGSIWLR